MKISLIIILSGDIVRSTEHIGVGYLASCLRERNYEVKVHEIKEQDIEQEDKYISTLNGQDFACITTTSVTMKCMNMKNIAYLTDILKRYYPNMQIACDGYMATFRGQEILEKYHSIDYTIQGEGEITLCELVDAIENKRALSKILGLTYRNKNEIVQNKSRLFIEDLNSLPFPSRDQFEQHQGKFQYIRLSSSRGCLGNCAFCCSFLNRYQDGVRWRGRTPDNIVDEIELLVKKYNFHTYDFLDWTFEDPGEKGKTRIRTIAQEIINRKLNIFYNCCFRAENWSEKDYGLIKLLVDSGLEKVNIGFESGNDRGLKILNKNATMEDNWIIIKILKNFPEIYVTFGFIMLHPYSTKEDILDNANFLHNTGMGQVIRHYFWMLEVYPGTLLERKLKCDALLDEKYDIYDGMYMYHFVNSDMEKLVIIFQEMLNLKSIWDFEIFDILIHTFISRIRKKYGEKYIMKELDNFNEFVNMERIKIADFNYEFFMKLVENRDNYDIEANKKILDNFIRTEMDIIKAKQYKLGLNLRRKGFTLDIN